MNYAATPYLENSLVRLVPLSRDHAADLRAAVSVGELWRTWYTPIPAPDAMAAEIESRLAQQAAGLMAPWAVVDATSGRAMGMTTYMNIDEPNRRLEIGSTWLGREAHGTGINASAKLLLLSRAFEDLQCNAVEFRTHWHNHQSRAAISRLGAKQDGVLRNHKIWHDGTLRDTVVFSIIASEWPAAKSALTARIDRHR